MDWARYPLVNFYSVVHTRLEPLISTEVCCVTNSLSLAVSATLRMPEVLNTELRASPIGDSGI